MESLKDENDKLVDLHKNLSGLLNEKNGKEKKLKDALLNRLNFLKKFLEIACLYENDSELFQQKAKKIINDKDDESTFDDLQEVVNLKYNGIVDYLRETYPDLNNDDINLCCMISFGFSTNEICMLYGLGSINTIYNKRYKLRKKFNLGSSDINVETHIMNIIAMLSKDA